MTLYCKYFPRGEGICTEDEAAQPCVDRQYPAGSYCASLSRQRTVPGTSESDDINTRLMYCSSLPVDIGEAYQTNMLMQ